jgi:hypothetical protein
MSQVQSFMSMVAWLKSECCNVALCRISRKCGEDRNIYGKSSITFR